MLQENSQNVHRLKLPPLGAIGHIVGLSTIDPHRKCIVTHSLPIVRQRRLPLQHRHSYVLGALSRQWRSYTVQWYLVRGSVMTTLTHLDWQPVILLKIVRVPFGGWGGLSLKYAYIALDDEHLLYADWTLEAAERAEALVCVAGWTLSALPDAPIQLRGIGAKVIPTGTWLLHSHLNNNFHRNNHPSPDHVT